MLYSTDLRRQHIFRNLPRLKTLRALNLPRIASRCDFGEDTEPFVEKFIADQLTRLAGDVFREGPGSLNIVSFGRSGQCVCLTNHLNGDERPPLVYGRAELINFAGRRQTAAMQVDLDEAREIEPTSDILDIDVKNTHEAFLRYGEEQLKRRIRQNLRLFYN